MALDIYTYRLDQAKKNIGCAKLAMEGGFFGGSVNRSYYAMFSAARALLALKGLDSAKHSGVISLFNRGIVKAGLVRKEMGGLLNNARRTRTEADYKDFVEPDGELAREQTADAERFIIEIEKACKRLIDAEPPQKDNLESPT